MFKESLRQFMETDPQIGPLRLNKTAQIVAEGLELGNLEQASERVRNIPIAVARTLILNRKFLGIPIPAVKLDSGTLKNKAGESVDYLAYTKGVRGSSPFIAFSRRYINAIVDPFSVSPNDAFYSTISIVGVTAHECYHMKELMDYPWKLSQDVQRADNQKDMWDNARSEKAAQGYESAYKNALNTDARREAALHKLGMDPFLKGFQVFVRGKVAAIAGKNPNS